MVQIRATTLIVSCVTIILETAYAWDHVDPTKHPSWRFFDNEKCGLSSQSNRIIGGVEASIGAYPWIARLGYFKKVRLQPKTDVPPKPRFNCGGTVLTEYYIVTAAHCAANLPPPFILGLVRLGEFDSTTNPDCDEDDECADPVQDFLPQQIIIHENFGKPSFKNDVCLVQTDRKIRFSRYVRPICMMPVALLNRSFVGESCEIAGWGRYDIDIDLYSSKLLTVTLPVVENLKCERSYRYYAEIGSTQMCVGGIVGKDSCNGDSGGPLVKVVQYGKRAPRYYLLGIVSFGTKDCASSDMPGVYTRLSDYVGWIMDHMHKRVNN